MSEKIQRFIRKLIIKLSPDKRPGSAPFLSGDTFRKLADHIYDETHLCKPDDIGPGQIVFVNGDLIESFFNSVHPLIKEPYKLITHNSDKNITEKEIGYLDGKIIHWFAQNVLISHPKITPIPIGLENAHHANTGNLRFFRHPNKASKNGRILVNFNTSTNIIERNQCLEAMRQNTSADIMENRLSQKNFIALLDQYSAIASPPGNGEDCHRTWEALYRGTKPIVKKSVAAEYFASLGVPILLVNDWKDVLANNTQTFNPLSFEALWIDYWKKMILSK